MNDSILDQSQFVINHLNEINSKNNGWPSTSTDEEISNVDDKTNTKKFTFSENVIQKTVYHRDLVFCVQYQAPGVVHFHPNTGRGTYSQGVYILKGLLNSSVMGYEPFEIKEGEYKSLEEFKDVPSRDVAGPEGVMMVHINPLSGSTEYNIEFIGKGTTKTIKAENKRKFVFCLDQEVMINGVLINNLQYVILKKNTSAEICVGEHGACVVLEKLDNAFDGLL